jgi:hypothetical protein
MGNLQKYPLKLPPKAGSPIPKFGPRGSLLCVFFDLERCELSRTATHLG